MTDALKPAPSAEVGTPRRALGFIVLAELLAMSLWFSASAVAPELAEEWDLAGGRTAWLTASVQLGFVLGALVSAILNLADRFPAHRLFGWSALAGAGLTAAIPLLDVGLEGAILLRFLTGVALAGVYPPGMKLAASWSVKSRGLAIGLLVGALTLGSALPHLLSALSFGPGERPAWRTVLLLAAGLAALASAVVALRVRPGPHLARSAPFDWRFATRVFTDRPVRLANLGYLGHMWELYAVWTWVPLLLLQSYESAGLSPVGARLAGFGTIAAGALGSVLAGRWADRFGRTLVASASLIVSGSCCLFAGALFDAPLLLTALCFVWGFAVVADSAQFSAAVSELTDPRYVGTALAMQTSLGFLLTLLPIHGIPLLEAAFGWNVALATLAAGPLVGTVAMLRLRALPQARQLAGGRR